MKAIVKQYAWVLALLVVGCARGRPATPPPPPPETVTVASPPEREPTLVAPPEPPALAPSADTPDAVFGAALPATFESERAPRPPVRVGAVTVTGPRSAELTQRELLARVPGLMRCYDAALARSPKSGGSMRVRLVVLGTGAVKSAQVVQKQGSLDPQLADCAQRELARTTFPRAVPAQVEVAFPVVFSPNP